MVSRTLSHHPTCGAEGAESTHSAHSHASDATPALAAGPQGDGVHERNYGFPQEFEHLVDCVKHDQQPLVIGEDARVVMEIIVAAYESAGTGQRVTLPFRSPPGETPIQLWRP